LKTKKINLKIILIVCFGLVLIPAMWVLVFNMEGESPAIKFDSPAQITSLGALKDITVSFSDQKRGLRKIKMEIVKDGKETVLTEKEYAKASFFGAGQNKDTVSITIEPVKLGLKDGKALMRTSAWDYSWRRWWNGNITVIENEINIDTKRPEIDVLGGTQYINQGGAGVEIYRLSEPCQKSGVYAGGSFFPGYSGFFKDKDIYICFYALEHDKGPGTEIYALAVDEAGNSAKRGFNVNIKARKFNKDSIQITDSFLNAVVPQFDVNVDQNSENPLLDKYIKINRELRIENHNKLKELIKNSDKEIYWKGAFISFPNAANKASYADNRSYIYNGKRIDSQIHLGIDLASLSRAPVPAANNGKIKYVGDFGIYGKMILIDHGFGLYSLYGHLSSADVTVGQIVEKNYTIGHSGKTGLAGGDHLHFSMLVNDVFVNPIEWLDASWIRNNISGKISDAKSIIGTN